MATKRVAIVYHESFSRRSYLTQGTRLQDFPAVLENMLRQGEQFFLLHPPAIDEEWILAVHSREHLIEVMHDPLCSTAWHSVGSVVRGAEAILSGEADRSFALIGAGGHHAGRDFFWGYCCFNDVVITIEILKHRYGLERFAIVDTDAHHGDGTRSLIAHDPSILHYCICHQEATSQDGTKRDFSVYHRLASARTTGERNAAYVRIVSHEIAPQLAAFRPEILFWYFGFDTHRGDYGDIGLTVDAYTAIARTLTVVADKACNGRIEVVLGGGASRAIAREVIPAVIRTLGA